MNISGSTLDFPLTFSQRVKEFVMSLTATDWPVVGVDVSVYQGQIDWAQLATKAQFAYIRAGFGNGSDDGYLGQNRQGAKANNIPFGLYWYIKPGKSWSMHAESFASAYNADGGLLPPVFDIEETGGLSKFDLNNWLEKCVSRFEQLTGMRVMVYTSPSFWNTNMPQNNWDKWRELWIAHWTNAAQPILPYNWTNVSNPRTWLFWQWQVAPADGYGVQSTKIDLDRFNGTVDQFNARFGTNIKPLPGPAPEPTPEPEPQPQTFQIKVKSTATPYLNYRDKPNGADLGNLMPESVLTSDGLDGDWYHIVDGYVHKDFVTKL